jgi:catechol 2,3-dioxygenase-like lactoylglutathione lyase family enzyme
MTRRIERAMALLRRGDLTVTEVCFAVGCSSLGTFSTRFAELVGIPPSEYRAPTPTRHRGHAVLHREAGDQAGPQPGRTRRPTPPGLTAPASIRNRESIRCAAAPNVTAMDITIHNTFLPHDDPEESLAFYRDVLGFEVRLDVGGGKMRWITVGPVNQPGTSIVLHPPAADPGTTDDERRLIAEMMGQGHLRDHRAGDQGPRRHLRATAGEQRRDRAGADPTALRGARLRRARSRGHHGPHPGTALRRHGPLRQEGTAWRRRAAAPPPNRPPTPTT